MRKVWIRSGLWVLAFLISYIVLIASFYITPPPETLPSLREGANHVKNVAKNVKQSVEQPTPSSNTTTSGEADMQDAQSLSIVSLFKGTLVIFKNNLRVDLVFAIPFFGVFIYYVSLLVNGWVMKVLATEMFGEEFSIAIALEVLKMPHAFLEVFAYSVAFVEGGILSYYILRRRNELRTALKSYAMYLGVSIVILFVAALVEAHIILSG